jgi:hypothetical protein
MSHSELTWNLKDASTYTWCNCLSYERSLNARLEATKVF